MLLTTCQVPEDSSARRQEEKRGADNAWNGWIAHVIGSGGYPPKGPPIDMNQGHARHGADSILLFAHGFG